MARVFPGQGRLRRLAPLLVLAVLAIGAAVALRGELSYAALEARHAALAEYRDAHYGPSVLIFIGIYAAIVTLSLPGATVSTLTGGFLFGVWPGTLINMVAATLGASVLFVVLRAGLGRGLAARIEAGGGRVAEVKRGLDRNQWPMLFFIRLAPVIPFFVANVLPALLDVPLRRFVISTFLGILPGALIYTSVGAGLDRVLAEGGAPDLGLVFEPYVFLPLLGLAGLSLLPVILRRRRT
ncbi:TVP38/TMEM64 family protein [Pseudooceanicola sp. C21-150M6]|uniref:TVP38/TMEM64 family protein n=1 Tax=Pseudooceanicola sp. C21-150M6 TaxID=3434355 RepID=UPI003D7F1CE3